MKDWNNKIHQIQSGAFNELLNLRKTFDDKVGEKVFLPVLKSIFKIKLQLGETVKSKSL
jgi:hypothetical protein